jgi:hypothetical protein
MSSAIAHPIILTAHDSTQSTAIQSLTARVTVTEPRLLTVRFCLQADMSRIRVASVENAVPGRADGLWKHTCFEAFLRPGDSRGYYEFNFSPAKQWAAYHFDAYREGMTEVQFTTEPPGKGSSGNGPQIRVRKEPDRLELDVTVPLPLSVTAGAAPALRLAVTAVVEEENGRLCYWSARHPPGKPDFHHPDSFAIELAMKSAG